MSVLWSAVEAVDRRHRVSRLEIAVLVKSETLSYLGSEVDTTKPEDILACVKDLRT
jgi:hypothetical protein